MGRGGLVGNDGSYKIEGFAVSVDKEISRLKAQVELFWDKELDLLRKFGLCDGMRILECGSGPGHVLEKLLASFPNSHITGIEVDPFLAQWSRERLKDRGDGRLDILEQSATHLELPDNSFDFAIARLLLEHLPEPVKAVREARRVLKPGGRGVFIDNDFDLHLRAYPDIPELSVLYDAYCRCRIAEGGNPRIGRELPWILLEGGFSDVDLEVVCAHSCLIGDDAFQRSEGSGIPAQLLKNGYLSRDVLDKLTRNWHDTLQQKNHALFRELFVAVGTKAAFRTERKEPLHDVREKVSRSPEVDNILEKGFGEEKQQLLMDYLIKHMALSLRLAPDDILKDRPLIDLGVDSIISVELSNRLASDFNIMMSPVEILEAQSIVIFCSQILSKLDQRGEADPELMSCSDSTKWEEGEI